MNQLKVDFVNLSRQARLGDKNVGMSTHQATCAGGAVVLLGGPVAGTLG